MLSNCGNASDQKGIVFFLIIQLLPGSFLPLWEKWFWFHVIFPPCIGSQCCRCSINSKLETRCYSLNLSIHWNAVQRFQLNKKILISVVKMQQNCCINIKNRSKCQATGAADKGQLLYKLPEFDMGTWILWYMVSVHIK